MTVQVQPTSKFATVNGLSLLLLGGCRLSSEHRKEQRTRCRESSQMPLHLRAPPLASANSSGPFLVEILDEARGRTVLSQAHC